MSEPVTIVQVLFWLALVFGLIYWQALFAFGYHILRKVQLFFKDIIEDLRYGIDSYKKKDDDDVG